MPSHRVRAERLVGWPTFSNSAPGTAVRKQPATPHCSVKHQPMMDGTAAHHGSNTLIMGIGHYRTSTRSRPFCGAITHHFQRRSCWGRCAASDIRTQVPQPMPASQPQDGCGHPARHRYCGHIHPLCAGTGTGGWRPPAWSNVRRGGAGYAVRVRSVQRFRFFGCAQHRLARYHRLDRGFFFPALLSWHLLGAHLASAQADRLFGCAAGYRIVPPRAVQTHAGDSPFPSSAHPAAQVGSPEFWLSLVVRRWGLPGREGAGWI